MKKSILLGMPKLTASPEMKKVALEDEPEKVRTYSGYTRIRRKYKCYMNCMVQNGILKVALYLPDHLRLDGDNPAYEVFLDKKKRQFLTYDYLDKKWRDAKLDRLEWPGQDYDAVCWVSTGEQECYQFENVEDFRHVIGVRYRLIPYLYSEYMKAALNDDMYFRPLGFVYPEDKIAVHVEDQLLLGNEIMIAPVYEQNARGRYVYLPEEMKFVKFLPDGTIAEEILGKGVHYVEVALNEIPLFIRKGKCIPVAEAAECVAALDTKNMQLLGYEGAEYTLYEDDGIHKDYDREENYRVLKK